MDFLRTPDERFAGLADYPFAPNYVDVGGLRLHYIDEGPRDAPPVLMMHGEPSWSYLYRKMVPIVTAAGFRAILPDLIGFGRSDKPTKRTDYTYQRHVDWTQAFLDHVDLRDATLVCQDWGGLIGLRLVAENEPRFGRVVAANTMLPTGDQEPGEPFKAWLKFSQETPEFPVGSMIKSTCIGEVSDEVVAGYDAPFPDDTYKEGARQFPTLVPIRPDDPAAAANRAAWDVLKRWEKPFLLAFSDSDPITKGGDAVFQKLIPGCTGQPHTTITKAGHFLQEDKGEELAAVVVDFIRNA